jgi:hypothetical protein
VGTGSGSQLRVAFHPRFNATARELQSGTQIS